MTPINSSKTDTFNHLIKEKSPYLLQHAQNPVNWYPWGQDAFKKAHKEHKPIFLSIGYATCHWCHVMAHESFEDHAVAKLLNDNFVSIKVDREERPDIDHLYMTICQLLTGTGGWPLTIIMTPKKEPFYAATYIPKENRFGHTGLLNLLPAIIELWKKNPNKLHNTAQTIHTSLLETVKKTTTQKDITPSILDQTYEQLVAHFDPQYGGFGGPPKFPSPHTLLFLLRYWKKTSHNYALEMVTTTLDNMRLGGIYDHIGYGFHRYATDNQWILPHFEKMLYDQALLTMAYCETYQATKNPFYKQTSEEILTYVTRDMMSPEGGFYSAEDADTEQVEGKYYTWTYQELQHLLNEEEFQLFKTLYPISIQGNVPSNIHSSMNNQNIIYQLQPLQAIIQRIKNNEEQIQYQLDLIQKKLHEHRLQREHPLKDDKILSDWNGLMIAAFAQAAQVFANTNYASHAQQAADFILRTMLQSDGTLYHRYRQKNVQYPGYADDYAFFTWGLLELYQATFKPQYLQHSIDLTEYFLQHFWDEKHGGFYFTSDSSEQLLQRQQAIYDGAYPSANSVSAHNLLRLAHLTGNHQYEQHASKIFKTFSSQITAAPSGYSHMLSAYTLASGKHYEIVLVGNKNSPDTQKILSSIHNKYLPNKVLLLKQPNNETLEHIAPFLKNYTQKKSQTTAYICTNHHCEQPTTDVNIINQMLQ